MKSEIKYNPGFRKTIISDGYFLRGISTKDEYKLNMRYVQSIELNVDKMYPTMQDYDVPFESFLKTLVNV